MADIASLKKKLDQDPDSMAFAPLADAYRKDGQLDEAENVCVEGLKRHPSYVAGRLILARIYVDKEKFLESASVAQSVIKMDGENLLAHALMWQALIKLGRLPDAVKVIQRHLALNPSDPEAKRALEEVNTAMAAPPTDAAAAPGTAVPDAKAGTPKPPAGAPPPPPLPPPPQAPKAKDGEPSPAAAKGPGGGLPPPPPVPASLGGPKKEAGVQAGIAAGQAENLLKVADLYLKKGQAEKAEDAYAEVLSLDPGNSRAQKGLEEAKAKKSSAPPPPPPSPPPAPAAVMTPAKAPESKGEGLLGDLKEGLDSPAPRKAGAEEKEFDASAFEDKKPVAAPPPAPKKPEAPKGLDFSEFDDPPKKEPSPPKAPAPVEAKAEKAPEEPKVEAEKPAPVPEPPAPPKPSKELPDLIPVLEGVNRTSGIIGSMIVGMDGQVVAKAFNVDLETEALMRMVGTIFENTQKSVDRMKQGTLSQVMITAMHGQIFLNSTGRGILTILATEKVKIGILRLAINEAVKQISKE